MVYYSMIYHGTLWTSISILVYLWGNQSGLVSRVIHGKGTATHENYPFCTIILPSGNLTCLFTVSFPIENGGSFHRLLYVYQRVKPNIHQSIHPYVCFESQEKSPWPIHPGFYPSLISEKNDRFNPMSLLNIQTWKWKIIPLKQCLLI